MTTKKRYPHVIISQAVAAFGTLLVLAGCNSPQVTSTSSRDTMTSQVGVYSPPPAGLNRASVGVPPFEVDIRRGAVENMNVVAADQITTLLVNSGRFRVIERAQLSQLVKEQGLEGVVKWDELAKMGEVKGVDYLLLGKVTNFRVLASKGSGGFGIGRTQLPFGGAFGGFDYQNRNSQIQVECGVDLRLVDPTTGEVVAANFSEYERTDAIKSFDIQVLGVSAGNEADIQLSDDDQGRILRLAVDDALRKSLPAIDNALLARSREVAAQAAQ